MAKSKRGKSSSRRGMSAQEYSDSKNRDQLIKECKDMGLKPCYKNKIDIAKLIVNAKKGKPIPKKAIAKPARKPSRKPVKKVSRKPAKKPSRKPAKKREEGHRDPYEALLEQLREEGHLGEGEVVKYWYEEDESSEDEAPPKKKRDRLTEEEKKINKKYTVDQLKSQFKKRGIRMPKEGRGSGVDGKLLKIDLVRALIDAQAQGAEVDEFEIEEVISFPSDAEIKKMTVGELKKQTSKLNVKLPKKGSGARGNLIKKDYVQSLIDYYSQQSKKGEIEIPSKKPSRKREKKPAKKPKRKAPRKPAKKPKRKPSRKPAKKPKRKAPRKPKYTPRCGESEDDRICPDPRDVCDVGTGKCYRKRKTKKGLAKKRARAELWEKYGDDYFYDDKHNLVGRWEDVKRQLEYWGIEPDEDIDEDEDEDIIEDIDEDETCETKSCDEGEACFFDTDECIDYNDNAREHYWSLKTKTGNVIVGKEEDLKQLKKKIGGTLQKPLPQAPKRKAPKPPKKKKKAPPLPPIPEEDEDLPPPPPTPKKKKGKKPVKPKEKVVTVPPKISEIERSVAQTFAECLANISKK
jgi:hypothetical protein